MAVHEFKSKYLHGGADDEMDIFPSQELKIQATGSGSYQMFGKMRGSGAAKPLALINTGTLEISNTASGEDIYTCDVSGLQSVYADNLNGVSSVYVRAISTT